MNPFEAVPPWLLRPLPVSASVDDKINARIDELAQKLPQSFGQIVHALNQVRKYSEYDSAVNRASAHVWQKLEEMFNADSSTKIALLSFAKEHMVGQALGRIVRRLVKDQDTRVRAKARQMIEKGVVREVALPAERDGEWDPTGWLRGTVEVDVKRHEHGNRVLERFGLPPIPTLSALRKLLGIKSPAQLGWFLLASDQENGPYTTFTIPKRDGRA